MNNKISLLIVTTILFISGNIFAQSESVLFDDIDTDASGCISKEEAKAFDDIRKNFSKIDKDKGGTICLDEYTEYQNKGEFVPDEVEVPEVGAAPVM